MCCYMLSGKEVFLVFYWAMPALVLAPISALLSLKADGHRRGFRAPTPFKSGLQVCVLRAWEWVSVNWSNDQGLEMSPNTTQCVYVRVCVVNPVTFFDGFYRFFYMNIYIFFKSSIHCHSGQHVALVCNMTDGPFSHHECGLCPDPPVLRCSFLHSLSGPDCRARSAIWLH